MDLLVLVKHPLFSLLLEDCLGKNVRKRLVELSDVNI